METMYQSNQILSVGPAHIQTSAVICFSQSLSHNYILLEIVDNLFGFTSSNAIEPRYEIRQIDLNQGGFL